MRHTVAIALLVGCSSGHHEQVDAAPDGAAGAVDAAVDGGPCVHGQATTPATIHGRSFAQFQRANAQVVFSGDPFPAILIEAGPNPRCACDPPPAGGTGNTLITFITDWPMQAGPAQNDGVFMHVDTQTQPTIGNGTMTFTSVTKGGSVAGSMSVQFPGDPGTVEIAFDAVDCHAVQ
jgi:hypothetical protein